MAEMSLEPQTETVSDGEFEQQARALLGSLQAAVRGITASLPGINRRAVDLQRTLSIHATLAWQLHKLAIADDPLVEAKRLPGPIAMKRFLEAARRRGASEQCLDAALAAAQAIEQFIDDHADGRHEFESMLSGLTEDGAQYIDLANRRAAFTAQSHLFGLSAETDLACYIYAPNEADATRLDAATIHSIIGLRRLRRDASLLVASVRMSDEEGNLRQGYPVESFDPEAEAPGAPGLIPRFCTKPLPELKQTPTPDGAVNLEVLPKGLGPRSAITCTAGQIIRGAFASVSPESGDHHNSHTRVRTPCKVLIQDSIVHHSLFDRPPRTLVYADHRDVNPVLGRDCDLLPSRESAVYLGRGLDALRCQDAPQYEDIAAFAFERTGWDANDFDVYRCRIEFPIMPSSLFMQFDLPRSSA